MATFYDWEQETAQMEEIARLPGKRRKKRRGPSTLAGFICLAVVLGLVLTWGGGVLHSLAKEPSTLEEAPGHGALVLPEQSKARNIEAPDWVTRAILPVNEYSRPGQALRQVNGVVVHYVANPGTTAAQNRNYFAGLAQSHETWASCHFLIDTDGSVIQCVPLGEIAYCSNNRNEDTIAIECCHLDESGEFTKETTEALIRLLDWLIETYDLEREDILRHYDVSGKDCPRYFVQKPEEWEAFLDKLTF